MDLQDLYKEVIVDHNRSPRNFRKIDDANHHAEGYNPLCGDELELFLKVDEEGIITDVCFQGAGCAISIASASLMTQILKGKHQTEAETLFEKFHDMVTSPMDQPVDVTEIGKLAALAGVREFPSRVKCASLSWHTLQNALADNPDIAKTE